MNQKPLKDGECGVARGRKIWRGNEQMRLQFKIPQSAKPAKLCGYLQLPLSSATGRCPPSAQFIGFLHPDGYNPWMAMSWLLPTRVLGLSRYELEKVRNQRKASRMVALQTEKERFPQPPLYIPRVLIASSVCSPRPTENPNFTRRSAARRPFGGTNGCPPLAQHGTGQADLLDPVVI